MFWLWPDENTLHVAFTRVSFSILKLTKLLQPREESRDKTHSKSYPNQKFSAVAFPVWPKSVNLLCDYLQQLLLLCLFGLVACLVTCLLSYLLAWLDFAACVLLINSQHLSTSLTPLAPKQAKVWIFMYFWICQGTTSTSYFSDSFVIFAEAIDSSSLFLNGPWHHFDFWSLKL